MGEIESEKIVGVKIAPDNLQHLMQLFSPASGSAMVLSHADVVITDMVQTTRAEKFTLTTAAPFRYSM